MAEARHGPLDELRGVAVLVVFVSHAANDGYLPAVFGGGSGQMGVQLFFVLSGYLMARLYGAAQPDGAALAAFARARAARILPLYAAVVAAALAAAAAGWPAHYRFAGMGEAAAALTFLAAPQELWSIPVEVQFYAVFAALWAAGALRARTLAVVAALSLPIAAAWWGLVSEAPVLPPYLPAFAAGAWLGAVPPARLPAALGTRWAGGAALALLLLAAPGPRGLLGAEVWAGFYPRLWLDPLRLPAAVLLVACAARARPGAWLAGPPLAWVGTVSFAAYLIHRPVLRALQDTAPGPAGAALALALTLALAAASLSWLERPAARALRRRRAPHPRPARLPEAG